MTFRTAPGTVPCAAIRLRMAVGGANAGEQQGGEGLDARSSAVEVGVLADGSVGLGS